MLKVETDLFGGFVDLLRVDRCFAVPALVELAGACLMAADSAGDLDFRTFGRRCDRFDGDSVVPLGRQIDLRGNCGRFSGG